MSALPFVSCLCPTFGRPPLYQHLLEEAIECFLRQDYPAERTELLVLNDCPQQTLVCNAPQVCVLNATARYSSLGAKYNALIGLARGELLCPWEDDDLSLPWRLSLSVARLGTADYFNPKAYWFWCGDLLQHERWTGYAHNASLFRRSAWKKAGGYPDQSGPQDAVMDSRLRQIGRVVDAGLQAQESFFIYRWGVSDLHLSGQVNTEEAYKAHGQKDHKPGTFVLHPHWQCDYSSHTLPSPSSSG
jgi:hypothetical protein